MQSQVSQSNNYYVKIYLYSSCYDEGTALYYKFLKGGHFYYGIPYVLHTAKINKFVYSYSLHFPLIYCRLTFKAGQLSALLY